MAGPAFAGCEGKAWGCSGSCLRFCIYSGGFYRVPCVSLGKDEEVHICHCY
jgi:hypothetical protein